MSHYHHWNETIIDGLYVCPCRATNPPSVPKRTSEDAAAAIAPNAGTLRGKVYEFIKRMGRVTDEQICLDLGLNPSTARPRRIELAKAGLIRDSGAVAITKSGRRAVLWEAA